MKRKSRYRAMIAVLCIAMLACSAIAHVGEMDEDGGHYNFDGSYHNHPNRRQGGIVVDESDQRMIVVVPNEPRTEITEETIAEVDLAMAEALRDAAILDVAPWGLSGLVCWIFGVAFAYTYEPVPPVINLIGKTPTYVETYTRVYRMHVKKRMVDAALSGCAGATLIGIFLIIVEEND